MKQPHKKLIVILGMHRSGTSAVTRGLQTMGVDLGDRLMPPMPDNYKGFWEDLDLNALNMEILNAAGRDWHHLTLITSLEMEQLRKRGYLLRALELLRGKMNNSSGFGFKDPRVTKLLPFWKEVFRHCNCDLGFVLAIRNPLSVIRSLAARDQFHAEKSYFMWLEHVIVSVAETFGERRVLVDYDRLVQDPDTELGRVAAGLGLEIDPAALQIYKSEFLDASLRHTVFGLNDLSLDDNCPPLAREVYGMLLDVASGEQQLDKSSLKAAVDRWVLELERFSPLLRYADRIYGQNMADRRAIAERDELIAGLKLTVEEGEGQVSRLSREIEELHDRLATRDRTLADHDLRIEDLNQAVLKHKAQLDDLAATVAERDGRIADLNRTISALEMHRDHLLNSTCWRATYPLRIAGDAARSLHASFKSLLTVIHALGGPQRAVRRLTEVSRGEGLQEALARMRRSMSYHGSNTRLRGAGSGRSKELPPLLDQGLSSGGPLISVIMPVYNTPEAILNQAIMSVREQIYPKWELIVVDDCSSNPVVARVIRKHASEDKRILACFRQVNGNISKALNSGLEIAAGKYIAILDHDDTLDPEALYWVARYIMKYPCADYIYTDEDKMTRCGTSNFGPFFKPDWSPEYILSLMYTCHLGVYRSSIIRDIGGYRPEFDGAQDFDLTLRVLNRTSNIIHIPRVLYHWRVWEQSTARSLEAKPYACDRARRAIVEFLNSRGENYAISEGPLPGHHRVRFLPEGNPLISIIIPTANGTVEINGTPEVNIDTVFREITEKTTYRNYEIIIVHNGNLRIDQEGNFKKHENAQLVNYRANQFNLSQKINLGRDHASGDYLVLMNDDIRIISEDWLEQMVGMVQREGVGIVGPKLLFPDGRIQHAGVVLLGGLPGHAYYQWPEEAEGYGLGAKVNRNCLAVTGACAITPKRLFNKIGGFSERYPLNYNDIDYCLKLHRLGYRSVFLADVLFYHYEGVTKQGGRTVSDTEIQRFLEDWGELYGRDPYYNPNLNQSSPYN